MHVAVKNHGGADDLGFVGANLPISQQQVDIVLVGIDDDSFQYLDLQWPWPRSLHAKLLTALSAARARVVVFDVLFDTPAKDPDDDQLLSRAIAAHPNVILANASVTTEKETFTLHLLQVSLFLKTLTTRHLLHRKR